MNHEGLSTSLTLLVALPEMQVCSTTFSSSWEGLYPLVIMLSSVRVASSILPLWPHCPNTRARGCQLRQTGHYPEFDLGVRWSRHAEDGSLAVAAPTTRLSDRNGNEIPAI